MNITAGRVMKRSSIPNSQIMIAVKCQQAATTALHILLFVRWAKSKGTADQCARPADKLTVNLIIPSRSHQCIVGPNQQEICSPERDVRNAAGPPNQNTRTDQRAVG